MRYSNESKTKANGVVYTPTEMAEYVACQMLKYHPLPSNQERIEILDPAVGGGELLIALIKDIIGLGKKIRVVGYETDEAVGKETEFALRRMFPSAEIEVRIEDFLSAVGNATSGQYDYVIANPPYIRTQIMGSAKAQEIAEKLSLTGRVDIYYAFLVCTKEVLKKDGIAGYITSNKFMTIKAGSSVRKYMVQNYQLHHITDLGDTKLFTASVLPCIMIFSLGETKDRESVKFTSVYQDQDHVDSAESICGIFDGIERSGYFRIQDGRGYHFQQGIMQSVEGDALWTIASDDNASWLSRVEANSWMSFSQIGKVRVGIKTTADNVFIGESWTGEDANLELLRPLITHRNAGQIVPNTASHWQVLYPHEVGTGKKTAAAVDLELYPRSKAYLERHYEQLSGRKYVIEAHRNWYEIWVPQNPGAWQHKKIVFRDISERPEFWYDETGAVVNGDCYWIDIFPGTMEEIVYLALAVANSSFIEKYYDVKFNTRLYSGKRRYQTQYVEQFPIPFYGSPLAVRAIELVKTIIAESGKSDTSGYKQELDKLVDEMFA